MVEDDVKEIKNNRFKYLERVYKLADGQEFKPNMNAYDIGREMGFDRELTRKIWTYLKIEGLISLGSGDMISITHKGIQEVEEAISNPDKPTQYFPPVINIISVRRMISSQIQQASPGATQVVTISEDKYDELKKVIYSLKESIDKLSLQSQQKLELEAEIITIDTQISSPKPKSIIITEGLKSIRNILEGASGNVLAQMLLNQITPLLGG